MSSQEYDYSSTSFDYPMSHNTHTKATSPLHFLYPSFHSHSHSHSSASSSRRRASPPPLPLPTSSSSSSSPSSSSSSSYSPSAQRKTRSYSPKLSKSKSKSSSDISRLLDPSYLPSSSSPTRSGYGWNNDASVTTVKAYVDTNGELHDPDYRDFPEADVFRRSASPSTGSNYHHTNNANGGGAAYNRRRQSAASLGGAGMRRQQRPQFDWEVDLDESALDDVDEEEFDGFGNHYHTSNNNNNGNSNRYTYSPPSRSWSSSTNSNSSPNSNFKAAYYSPTGTTSTLPTSYEDNNNSPFETANAAIGKTKPPRRRLSRDERTREEREREKELRDMEEEREVREMKEKMEAEEEETRRVRRRSLELETRTNSRLAASRRRNQQQEERYLQEEAEEDEEESAGYFQNGNPVEAGTGAGKEKVGGGVGGGGELEYVPSCGQSLRRQWQALALRFRFGVFRAQRRMMRRVGSLL